MTVINEVVGLWMEEIMS